MIRYVLANPAWVILVVALFFVALIYAVPSRAGETCGLASWYGYEAGAVTRSGEHFNPLGLTAAMASPDHIGERYRVHYGRSHVDVRINDTGSFAQYGRLIDLSLGAAKAIGLVGRGVGTVCLERLP